MPENANEKFQVTDCYKAMFPEVPGQIIAKMQKRMSDLHFASNYSMQDWCIFHRAHVHPTRECPAYRMHYPGKGLRPTKNVPGKQQQYEHNKKR